MTAMQITTTSQFSVHYYSDRGASDLPTAADLLKTLEKRRLLPEYHDTTKPLPALVRLSSAYRARP